jgi:hypothetical protein
LLLVVNVTDGVTDVSARGARTESSDETFVDANENGPIEKLHFQLPLEAAVKDRLCSCTENMSRPTNTIEPNSDAAPTRNKPGTKFVSGIARLINVPSPSW